MQQAAPKLLDQLRDKIRVKHYSIRTEQAYVDWVRRFILFCEKRHPKECGRKEVEGFLTYLAVARNVSASTQSQAKSALLFLYKQVLKMELPWLGGKFQRFFSPDRESHLQAKHGALLRPAQSSALDRLQQSRAAHSLQ